MTGHRRRIDLGDERGQALVDYGMVILLVVIALVGTLVAFRTGVGDLYDQVLLAWP